MALVWETNMTGGTASIAGNGFTNALGSSSTSTGSLSDSTADMYSGAACYAIANRFTAATPGFTLEFAGNVTGNWDSVLITNQFEIPYSSFTRTYVSAGNYTQFVYPETDAQDDGYPDGYPRVIFQTNKVYNFKFYTSPGPSESYGFRCYTPTGKVVVSSKKAYIKLGASGSVSLGNNSSQTIPQENANSPDVYIFITAPSVADSSPWTLTRSSTGFTITNTSGSTQTFGYAVFRYA